MIFFDCKLHGKDSKICIYEEKTAIESKDDKTEFMFIHIKSLLVKNGDSYLLKIKSEDTSVICEFKSMHVRDLVKSVILSSINTVENMKKSAITCNLDYCDILKNLKNIIGASQFCKTVNMHESLFFQRNTDFTSENLPMALSQPIIDVFVSMNCSFEQFINQLKDSYFYSIKNKKNSVDRLISDRIRHFDTELDYATRINTYSLLNSSTVQYENTEVRANKGKEVEFNPIYIETNENDVSYSDNYVFTVNKPILNLNVLDEKEGIYFEFDPSDFEAARDMCKLIYINQTQNPRKDDLNDEAIKFTESFKNIIEGKYGKDALEYITTLLPTYYFADNLNGM